MTRSWLRPRRLVAGWLLVEVAVDWAVARAVGGEVLLLALVGSTVAGVWLLGGAARRGMWRSLRRSPGGVAGGAVPARWAVAAGFAAPGLAADVVGLLLVLPAVRRALGRRVARAVSRRVPLVGAWPGGGAARWAAPPAAGLRVRSGPVIDTVAVDTVAVDTAAGGAVPDHVALDRGAPDGVMPGGGARTAGRLRR